MKWNNTFHSFILLCNFFWAAHWKKKKFKGNAKIRKVIKPIYRCSLEPQLQTTNFYHTSMKKPHCLFQMHKITMSPFSYSSVGPCLCVCFGKVLMKTLSDIKEGNFWRNEALLSISLWINFLDLAACVSVSFNLPRKWITVNNAFILRAHKFACAFECAPVCSHFHLIHITLKKTGNKWATQIFIWEQDVCGGW